MEELKEDLMARMEGRGTIAQNRQLMFMIKMIEDMTNVRPMILDARFGKFQQNFVEFHKFINIPAKSGIFSFFFFCNERRRARGRPQTELNGNG